MTMDDGVFSSFLRRREDAVIARPIINKVRLEMAMMGSVIIVLRAAIGVFWIHRKQISSDQRVFGILNSFHHLGCYFQR